MEHGLESGGGKSMRSEADMYDGMYDFGWRYRVLMWVTWPLRMIVADDRWVVAAVVVVAASTAAAVTWGLNR